MAVSNLFMRAMNWSNFDGWFGSRGVVSGAGDGGGESVTIAWDLGADRRRIDGRLVIEG